MSSGVGLGSGDEPDSLEILTPGEIKFFSMLSGWSDLNKSLFDKKLPGFVKQLHKVKLRVIDMHILLTLLGD